jgi:predicted transcriptional regulator of viral defense system
MADKEKAMVDSMEKIWYAGGITQVIRTLKKNIDDLDVPKMVDYAVQMHSGILIQRFGYFLDALGVPFDEEFM